MNLCLWFLSVLYIYCYSLVPAEAVVQHTKSGLFPSVQQSRVRSHILSQPDSHTIHRFFDSSPVSPSNQYVATTTFSPFESSSMVYATVSIVNVEDGTTKIVDRTAAWDSQVGAQVQWGKTDGELFYNTVCQSNLAPSNAESATQSTGQLSVRGIVYNQTSHHARLLDCPIYHLSTDGMFSVSPNMLKIHHTQKGYGIRPLDSADSGTRNTHARTDDGLFLTSVATGQCSLLVSLHRLAMAAGMDTTSTPTYGFHAKFSTDGELVMFVVRTLEQPVAPRSSLVRVQHLFVVDRAAASVRRMISWASYPFRPGACAPRMAPGSSSLPQQCPVVLLRDGNHPNWIPNSHKISMNLQKENLSGEKESTSAQFWQGAAKLTGLHARRREGEWDIVSIDVDAHPEDFIYRYDTEVDVVSSSSAPPCTKRRDGGGASAPRMAAASEDRSPGLSVEIGSCAGSGHPIYHPSGKYIITDAYPKEMHALAGLLVLNKSALLPRSVPLRLIEVSTQREVWLLQMQVERSPSPFHRTVHKIGEILHKKIVSSLSKVSSLAVEASDASSVLHNQAHHNFNSFHFNGSSVDTASSTATCPAPPALLQHALSQGPMQEDKSWRCDLHPAWSRDFTLVAVNGRPGGSERQVVLLEVGSDLGRFFPAEL